VITEVEFYGLLLRELDGWYVRSLIRAGQRWECVISRTRGRAIEAAAADNVGLALRSAWRRVEDRIGRDV
jgi:hypothetical protein